MLGVEVLAFEELGAVPLVEVPVDDDAPAAGVVDDESERVARDCADDAVDDSLPITRDRKKLARLGRDVFLAPSSSNYCRPNQTRTTQLRRPRTTSRRSGLGDVTSDLRSTETFKSRRTLARDHSGCVIPTRELVRSSVFPPHERKPARAATSASILVSTQPISPMTMQMREA